jgi:hypothetical protein
VSCVLLRWRPFGGLLVPRAEEPRRCGRVMDEWFPLNLSPAPVSLVYVGLEGACWRDRSACWLTRTRFITDPRLVPSYARLFRSGKETIERISLRALNKLL